MTNPFPTRRLSDVGSQPTLVEVPLRGRMVPALAQPTKRGELFLLDRRTGAPIAAVEERPAPRRPPVSGDWTAPTQPYSVGMPSLRSEERRVGKEVVRTCRTRW